MLISQRNEISANILIHVNYVQCVCVDNTIVKASATVAVRETCLERPCISGRTTYIPIYNWTQGKNITWNMTCPMDGCPKKLPAPLPKLDAQTFRFPSNTSNMQVYVVGETFNTEDREESTCPLDLYSKKYICPQSKLTCPGHSGSVMFLPCEPVIQDHLEHCWVTTFMANGMVLQYRF